MAGRNWRRVMVKKAKKKVVKSGFPKRTEYCWRYKEDTTGWVVGYYCMSDLRESVERLKSMKPKNAKTLQIATLKIVEVVEEEDK
jgi:hypothetical protein